MPKKKNVQDALKRILNTFLSKIIYFGLTIKPLKPSFLVGPKGDGLREVDCITFTELCGIRFYGIKSKIERLRAYRLDNCV